MGARIDLAGQRFGRLLVVSFAGHGASGKLLWLCRCDCTAARTVTSGALRGGTTKSCGCWKREVALAQTTNTRHGHAKSRAHGQKQSPTYRSWVAMVKRCENPHDPAFARYGGRGITVCERWRDFVNFLADMGERPNGKTLDRFPDNDGGYEPGNCRWATSTEQNRNSRGAKVTEGIAQEILGRLEHGECGRSIARRLGLATSTISDIQNRKRWPELLPLAIAA